MAAARNDPRLDFRLNRQQKERIEKAVCVCGESISDFATAVLVEKDREVVEAERVRALSERDAKLFLFALATTPPALPCVKLPPGTRSGMAEREDIAWEIEGLSPEHDRSAFCCGERSLDDFPKRHAIGRVPDPKRGRQWRVAVL